jgi:hypothetical protein
MTMKTMFPAAAVALTLGIGSAYARPNPDLWGTQIAQQSAPNGHSVTPSKGDSVGAHAMHTERNVTSLFPFSPLGGGG